jgi:hypothetical protein
VLGDVEADGLERGAIHGFATGPGIAVFLPLGYPTTWRVMAMENSAPPPFMPGGEPVATQSLSLEELQTIIDAPTHATVKLREAAWLTRFRLHHRQARRYRERRLFVAGDAAHVHSPVGGQGMNTGIQDAWNLGWKLALVVRGEADERLLDSYHAERWPVGRTLLRVTDRLFGAFAQSVSGGPFMTSVRRLLVRDILAPVLSRPRIRAAAFHFVSQLGVRYRTSPVVREGTPRLRRGPRAGDRFPDYQVDRRGERAYLHDEMRSPHLHLLLCGTPSAWDRVEIAALQHRCPDLIRTAYLSREPHDDALLDTDGRVLERLGVTESAHYIVRPDGHVAFRSAGMDLAGASDYLAEWLTRRPDDSS